MFKFTTLILLLLFCSSSFAYDISGIKLGEQLDNHSDKLPTKLKSEPQHKSGKDGFMGHVSYTEELTYNFLTRPDGSIYEIRLRQQFPVKQADSVKEKLCHKYQLSKKECVWSIRYEDTAPNRTDALFSSGRYNAAEDLKVSIKKAMAGRKIRDGFIEVDLILAVPRSTKEYDRWLAIKKEKLRQEKMRASAQKTAGSPEIQPAF